MSGGPKSKPPEGLAATNLEDLRIAWRERLEEAETLERAGYHSTTAGLRLYALEILVKVVICEHLGLSRLPAVCKTHDLGSLLIHTGRWSDVYPSDKKVTLLRANWDVLVNYGRARLNDLRYEPRAEWTAEDAANIKAALHGPAGSPEHGVATWLSRHT